MKIWLAVQRDPTQFGNAYRTFATLEAAMAAFPDYEWLEERYSMGSQSLGRHASGLSILVTEMELEGDDHFVTFDQYGYRVEHPPGCPYLDIPCVHEKAIEGIAVGMIQLDAEESAAVAQVIREWLTIAQVIREWLTGMADYMSDELRSLDRSGEVTAADLTQIEEIVTTRHVVRVLRRLSDRPVTASSWGPDSPGYDEMGQ